MSAGARAARDLLAVLRAPLALAGMDPGRVTDVLAAARSTDLLGRIGARARRTGVADRMPDRLRGALEAPLTAADAFHRMARFETDRLCRVLRDVTPDLVLLKGSAYVLAGLPPAEGRALGDVDILVPRDRIDAVEASLIAAGWLAMKTSAYDQRYYRQWMHELPPLRHRERQTIVDLHHTILPLSGRLRPDAAAMIAAATPVAEWPGVGILAPADMVLHTAAHAFQDGDLRNALRELVDVDDLIRHFAPVEGFWPSFVERARRHQLTRPAFYAIRYAERLLGTEIDRTVRDLSAGWAPPRPQLALMDRLVTACLLASGSARVGPGTAVARRALFVRSHWLRMPPGLLGAHLARKAWSRLRGSSD